MKIVESFISEAYRINNASFVKASLLTFIGFLVFFTSFAAFVVSGILGDYAMLYLLALPLTASFFYLAMIRYSGNLQLCINFFITSLFLLVILFVSISKGIHSPYLIWMVGIPISGYLFSGRRFGTMILGVTIVAILAFGGIEYFNVELPKIIMVEAYSYLTLLNTLLFLVYMVCLVNLYLKIVKEHQSELEVLNEKFALSNIELERFAYIASHDMKTPIRNIISFLNLTERRAKGELSPALLEYIGFASKSAKELNQLIEDILSYSKVTKAESEFETIDLNQTLDDVSKTLTDLEVYQNAKIEFERLPIIKAENSQMTQLFQNLIENGIKYNQSEAPQVKIKYKIDNQNHLITIEDNGIGIEEDYHKTIFEMFKRLNNKDQYEGTGIGLAICKKIVERYHGNIWVESESDSGSRFYLRFPMN